MSDDSTKPAVDLLSGDGSEEEAAVPPASADAAKFSIDDDEDIDKLEGNYSDDDDDDVDRNISALASRTNSLINSYRDYIAEMSNDPIVGGDAAAAASVIEVMEGGKTAPDEEENVPEASEEATPLPPGAKGFIGQFQDARKGATLYSDYTFKDDPPHQNNNINLRAAYQFDHDDHSFANYNETLQRGSGRGRYCYAMFRSAAFRRCAIGLILIGAIVGISVGISQAQQRKKNLPDWEGMLAEEEGQQSGTAPIDPSDAQAIAMSYQQSALKYHPVWFSRDQGWNGQTYDAASSYCASHGGLVICPFEAICPAGVHTMPLGGKKAGGGPDESSWAPFSDVENAWIQVGITENWCEKLDGAPQWGANGEGVTRYVACCRADTEDDFVPSIGMDSSIAVSGGHVEEEFGNQMFIEKYKGQWFDRTNGWAGSTYMEATSFCASQGKMIVCPYDGYCPEGENSVPFGGVKVGFNGERDQWAPIGDKYNEWVNIGADNKCVTLSNMGEERPAWEFTQEGSKSVTQHLMCCPLGVTADDDSAPAPTAVVNNAPAQPAVASAEATQAQFDWAAEAYDPKWFDRSKGWLGTNYGEAVNFCKQEQGRTVCPYEAYCPMTKAPGSVPFGGVKPEYSWAPIDDAANWWVQVSGSDTCRLYNEMNGGPPTWGADGNNEIETRYVMCCKQPDAGMGDADYYHSSMSDETETLTEVVIDKNECQDHPTAVITTDGKTCETFIAHVGRVALHNARCSHETPLKGENGEVLLIRDVCRLSCGECGNTWPNEPVATTSDQSSAERPQPSQTVEVVEENNSLVGAETNFKISRYDRGSGWGGSSYYDALKFCGRKGATLCPYEAYCPQGPGKVIVGGAAASSQWVPFINVANGWIQSGPEDTCMPYNSLNSFPPEWGLTGENKAETSAIMCCETADNWIPADQTAVVTTSAPSDIDKAAMDMFKPIWYGRKHGWQGGTYQDAEKFCNNIGDMEICPILALCPDGKTLFNDKPPFIGEQWAPIAEGGWALIGSDGEYFDFSSVCSRYQVLTNQPSSELDRMGQDKKQHIMCCAKNLDATQPDDMSVSQYVEGMMDPTWYGKSDGWNGGSHSDAINYCQKNAGGKALCPYVGYCPDGEGYQPSPGHPVDFNSETAQWSPWAEGAMTGWVMVSQKYQNSATTCMSYKDLEGGTPPWDENGSSTSFAESKKYILCCNMVQPPPELGQSPQNPIPLPPPPTKPPTPRPVSPPTPKPTFPPQAVKWYPMSSDGEPDCVQGSNYDPYLVSKGWTYQTETDCCNAWKLDCGTKEVKWYPTESNGKQMCVEGSGYPWSFATSGFLFTTEQQCCESIGWLDCSPPQEKWYPTIIAGGEKACIFGIPESIQFDSQAECCSEFPLACPTSTTTTTTTTTTRPAVVTPPCEPKEGKGCHWWPKLVPETSEIKCIYSSDWPLEAADHLYSVHDSCYCTYNDC